MIYLYILSMGEGTKERGRRVRERKENNSNQPTKEQRHSRKNTLCDKQMDEVARRGRHSRTTTRRNTQTRKKKKKVMAVNRELTASVSYFESS